MKDLELESELDAAEAELVRYSNALTGYRTFEESGVEAVKRMRAELAAANQRIAELQARLRAWEETAEHYCAPNTPISADGVRGYIAELEAQLAAANQRIEAMESEFEDVYAAANEMYSVYAHAE